MDETETFTESCGCVFCDVGLQPVNAVDGRLVHLHPTRGNGYSYCTNPAKRAEPAKVIDLNERRNAAERPDKDFIRKDDFGREMFLFTLSYDLGNSVYGSELWAYDADDAAKKVAAMRESLRCDGQVFCIIPA